MSGSGKGGNKKNRKHFSKWKNDSQKRDLKKQNTPVPPVSVPGERSLQANGNERLQWTAPILPKHPVTTPDCPWCGKPIKDITNAITDKETNKPVHFDCVLNRISNMEILDKNDSICYIGGGRFAVIHNNNPANPRSFIIKKIFEWEVREIQHHEWRRPFSEYFSIT